MSEHRLLDSANAKLPRCMMPDGGDCCPEYHALTQENRRLLEALEHCRELASRDGPPISMAVNILNEIEATAKAAIANGVSQ